MSAHTTFGCTQKGLLWPDTRMNDDSANTVLSSQHRQCLAKRVQRQMVFVMDYNMQISLFWRDASCG